MIYYLHIFHRSDNEPEYPMTWTEYRLSDQADQIPEYLEAINVEENLEAMKEYCKDHGIVYEVIDHRQDQGFYL